MGARYTTRRKKNMHSKELNPKQKIQESLIMIQDIKALVKICALASDSNILDSSLQISNNEEFYLILRQVNSMLMKLENTLGS